MTIATSKMTMTFVTDTCGHGARTCVTRASSLFRRVSGPARQQPYCNPAGNGLWVWRGWLLPKLATVHAGDGRLVSLPWTKPKDSAQRNSASDPAPVVLTPET